ncbi:hypothetical protein STSO111631_19490 [Stackebrandtia soli]
MSVRWDVMSDPQRPSDHGYPDGPGWPQHNPPTDAPFEPVEYVLEENQGYPDAPPAAHHMPQHPQQTPQGPYPRQAPHAPYPQQPPPHHGPQPGGPPQWMPQPPPQRSKAGPIIAIALAVVLVLGLGAWGVIELSSPDGTGDDSDKTASGEPRAETRDGGILVGKGDTKVEIFLDFGCPPCQDFESQFGDRIASATEANAVEVVYHPLGVLDQRNEEYSSRAAAAAICAADEYAFQSYAGALFDQQPAEGSALENATLIEIGTNLGLSNSFDNCVNDDTYVDWVKSRTKEKLDGGVVGVPLVRVNGEDLTNPTDFEETLRELGY